MANQDPSRPEPDRPSKQQLLTALKQVALSSGQTVIVAFGPQVIVHRGELNATEAQDIAAYVAGGWQERGQTARIQFRRLPAMPEERLLYSLPLNDGFLLSIVESADMPLSQVTHLARRLIPLLESAGLTRYNPAL
jgi:hypothetical protein